MSQENVEVVRAGIFTIRNGKIRVAEFFWDHSEALATLGLSEQDAQD